MNNDTRVIEVDEFKRNIIVNALNDKRNELTAKGRDTDFIDETLLDVIAAPFKKRKRKREVMVR
jgi:hypothetical protein